MPAKKSGTQKVARPKHPRRPVKKKKTRSKKGTSEPSPQTLKALRHSQFKLKMALQAAHMGIWELNLRTNKVVWSDHVYQLFGQTRKSFNGTMTNYLNLVHPDDREKLMATISDTVSHKKKYFTQHRVVLPDGSHRWMEALGNILLDKKGNPSTMTGSVQDITSIKLNDLEKENWKTRYDLIAASTGHVIYDYDIQTGSIVWCGQIADVIDYTAEEIGTIQRWMDLIHPDDRQEAVLALEKAKQALRTYDVRYRFRKKKNGYAYLHDRGFFMANGDGKAYRMMGSMQDITERKLSEELLQQRERSYRELFDTVSEAIYIMNPDGTFIDVNKGACAMYGYDKADFIGRTPAYLSAEGRNDLGALEVMIGKCLQGEPQSFEWWGKGSNGKAFLKEVRITKGSYFGKEIIIATARDVTRQRESVEALRESEQRFRTLQQASFGGIGLHDQGVILDCNQGLCDITGYTYKELVGKNGLELIAPECRESVMKKIQSNYERPYDVEGLRKDGSRFFLEIHGKGLPYQGRVIRVTEFRDITDRKKSEEKILEQNAGLLAITDDLKRKNEQLEEFTQIVSHNLRAPVGNILTLLNFLETAATPEEQTEYISHLKDAGKLILTTLHELTDVLQLRQNRNIEKQELRFDEVFQHVRTMLIANITEADASVSADFSEAPVILYPHIYLESILLNLLSNALKYVYPERKPVIRFRTYYQHDSIMLEVSDNGIGIDLNRYGHQIFKLRKTFHRHPESRGVGLFMIKNQLEAMGGEISISSKENEGTTFCVNFNKDQTHGQ